MGKSSLDVLTGLLREHGPVIKVEHTGRMRKLYPIHEARATFAV